MVRFALPDALRAVPGLVIYFDGISLRRAAWDEPMAVSPGSHTATLRADGKRREQLRVEVASGGPLTIALPTELVPAPSSPVTSDYGLPRAKVGPAMRDAGIALTVIGGDGPRVTSRAHEPPVPGRLRVPSGRADRRGAAPVGEVVRARFRTSPARVARRRRTERPFPAASSPGAPTPSLGR